MGALVIMSIGTKPHFKRVAVRDTAGRGTREWQRTGAPHLRLAQCPPQELNPALAVLWMFRKLKWMKHYVISYTVRTFYAAFSTLFVEVATDEFFGMKSYWKLNVLLEHLQSFNHCMSETRTWPHRAIFWRSVGNNKRAAWGVYANAFISSQWGYYRCTCTWVSRWVGTRLLASPRCIKSL